MNKKDNLQDVMYITVTCPLLVALFALMMMSFGARAGNHCQYFSLSLNLNYCQYHLTVTVTLNIISVALSLSHCSYCYSKLPRKWMCMCDRHQSSPCKGTCTDVIRIQTQNGFCCFPSVTFEPLHYLLNFRVFLN